MIEPNHAHVVAADPTQQPNASLVIAAVRAGHVGLFDIDSFDSLDELASISDASTGQVWVRPLRGVDAPAITRLPTIVTAVVIPWVHTQESAQPALSMWRSLDIPTIVQVVSIEEARAAVTAGADGLLASGSEAGGRVGDTEAFILFQQCVRLAVPVWVRGGIGLHTAPAIIAGGGSGVVLDGQLSLAAESKLAWPARRAIAAMDGSETRVVGGFRFYTRPDLMAASIPNDSPADDIAVRLGSDLSTELLPIGQGAAMASSLADRFATVGGIVQAIAASIDDHLEAAIVESPLAPNHGVATAHRTTFPIVQGPMTRVSDRAEFALAVAEGGGLPFLALALMSGDDVRTLLEHTAELIGDRSWGVGILGFVPPEVRAEQLEVVHDVCPPFALIAGGRPAQAQPLEDVGISTYLHVPSPGLLDRFLAEGARKFVFEGRECGGHVGPRSSFALWEAQLSRLAQVDDPSDLQILLAGGIHDERSAAMAATAAAPLVARGANLGVLMGTAYLFTAEAVTAGAIQPAFQNMSVDCERTVLLETSPGHATRCVETNYVADFRAREAELVAEGVDVKSRWAVLETLNLGRLRIASKGLIRDANGLSSVDESEQLRDGMYMIGEVATLESEITDVASLHRRVSEGSVSFLATDVTPSQIRVQETQRVPDQLDIAIIGMDSFFPGSVGADQFWANILAGTNDITEVPPSRWDTDLYYDADSFTRGAGRKTCSKWGGFLSKIGFDPLQYGIPPTSLSAIEPVQLLSLEVAARALRDAGYETREFDRSRASVIFGAESGNELGGAYGARAFLPQVFGAVPDELESYLPALTEDSFPGILTNVIAGRIANRLDLGGVNYTIDAACASSLAAVDAACKELRSGISDLVVCGGADLHNGLNDYLMFASVHALSATGQCRTFDADADGIALGEGIACVVLKRRVDAERDGDRIYAIIDAVAGSSDGRSLGLTAPRKEGQQQAVIRAWAQARTSGSSLGLIEAHGTGTIVGDRTELATLTELFRNDGAEVGATVLGSVKSQIGHTKCAAGLAGIIKAAKAVHHGVLPPTRNIAAPTPYFEPDSSPFRFIDRPQPWPSATRRAGVSAFGFGGTNFHVVLSSHPDHDVPAHGLDRWPAELFCFRAPTLPAAQKQISDLALLVDELRKSDPDEQRHRLRDLACSISSAGSGTIQAAIVADNFDQLAECLHIASQGSSDATAGVFISAQEPVTGLVGFLYPGQGSQRPGMLADLFIAFPWLGDILRDGERWTHALFPPTAFSSDDRAEQKAAITATDVAQPTLGMASLAMTKVLRRCGVEPDVAGGHSYGELAALAAAGAIDPTVLLKISAARGESILAAIEHSGGDAGTMAAVELTCDGVAERLHTWPDLVVANHNGPTQTVISGPTSSVESAVDALVADGIRAKVLPVACAFHSPLIAMAGKLFAEHLGTVELGEPAFPVWSNVTAEPYPNAPGETTVAEMLAEQVTSGVRFVEEIESMYATGVRTFIEAGPGRVLTKQVTRILGDRPHTMVACDVSGEHGIRRLLLALAELASVGIDIDVASLFSGRAQAVDLRGWPSKRPGWSIDGAIVRDSLDVPLPNSLQPANEMPAVAMTTSGSSGAASGAVDQTVLEYLQNVRQLVAAERDIMLSYLGSAPVASGQFDAPRQTAIPTTTAPVAIDAAQAVPTDASGASPRGADLLAVVLDIVSDRTGYPIEMLDPSLDLEADLSIDSIKRIEIIGELAKRVGLTGVDESSVDEDMVEELAQLKSLQGIVDWIDSQAPAVTSSASPATATDPSSVPRGADLLAVVLDIVSDRTGYPIEMLDPSLDLEADLSIDSIKRIEIIGELAKRVGLTGVDESSVDEDMVEELAQLKSLQGIVDWIDSQGTDHATATSSSASTDAHPEPTFERSRVTVPAAALRYVASTRLLEPATPRDDISGRSVAICGADTSLSHALANELQSRGALVDGTTGPGEADIVIDLSTLEPDATSDARNAFVTLRSAALGRATRVMTVSGTGPAGHTVSGSPGLVRALSREFPELVARSVAIGDLVDIESIAVLLVDELLDPDAPVTVSLAEGRRASPRLDGPSELVDGIDRSLDASSVVVVTGGARGITARVAVRLAESTGCHLVLVGRSALPEAEDPQTADAADPIAIRRALLAIGTLRTPAEVEQATVRILADREIRATIDAISSSLGSVEYHAVDVRSDAFPDLLDEVRARRGRLDGFIHGAGVLDDHFVRDKSTEGFDRVFGTKVEGARSILAARDSSTLFTVLFGSVSGVFGNRGQCDYAAANDALDALAHEAAGDGLGRTVSIDWGPWGGGGMVSAELEREYERRGIGLLNPDQGVDAVCAEIGRSTGPSQIVVMRGTPEAFSAGSSIDIDG